MIADIHNKSYENFVKYIILESKDVMDKQKLFEYIRDMKVFELEGDIKNLLLNTNNKLTEKNLPFHDMFIDVNFFEEDITIQGIQIGDRFSPKLAMEKGYQFYTNKEMTSGERLIRFYVNHFKKGLWISMSIPLFSDVKDHWKKRLSKEIENDFIQRGSSIKEAFNEKNLIKLFKRIQLFANNFIDFLNHPDIETKIIRWYNNEKRISRGQRPIPDRANINLKGKLYRYIYEDIPKQEHSSPKNSFWVRGHYIHFWNQKRFNKLYNLEEEKLEKKGYYKDKQGVVSKWVLPYIKGRGKIKKKDYKLKRGGKR